MTSPIEPRTASLYHASRGPAVEPMIGAAIVLAAMASYLVVPALVPRDLAFLVAQATLAAVALAGVLVLRVPRPLAALGLRGARPRYWFAAIAIGATAWYLNAWLVVLILPNADAGALEALVDRPPLAGALAQFALVPAVCEELVFRGVLARSLGRHLTLIAAVAISAVAFAAYHVSVIQALPTLTLGGMLAVLAIRADSIAPTIVAHAINNAAAIAMSRHALPAVIGWLDGHPALAIAGCAAATGAGLVVAARGAA